VAMMAAGATAAAATGAAATALESMEGEATAAAAREGSVGVTAGMAALAESSDWEGALVGPEATMEVASAVAWRAATAAREKRAAASMGEGGPVGWELWGEEAASGAYWSEFQAGSSAAWAARRAR
jgi:hypothetical protein